MTTKKAKALLKTINQKILLAEIEERLRDADVTPVPRDPLRMNKSGVGKILKTTSDGIVEALVNTYGIRDAQGDRLLNGVFAESIKGDPSRFRVLDQHSLDSVTATIATPLAVWEGTRRDLPASIRKEYPNATGGLFTRNLFMLDDELSARIYARLAAGAAKEWSIGFTSLKHDTIHETINNQRVTTRVIRVGELFEWSCVVFGAGVTATTSVKRMVDTHSRMWALPDYATTPPKAIKVLGSQYARAKFARKNAAILEEATNADAAYKRAKFRYANGDLTRRQLTDAQERAETARRALVENIEEREYTR